MEKAFDAKKRIFPTHWRIPLKFLTSFFCPSHLRLIYFVGAGCAHH